MLIRRLLIASLLLFSLLPTRPAPPPRPDGAPTTAVPPETPEEEAAVAGEPVVAFADETAVLPDPNLLVANPLYPSPLPDFAHPSSLHDPLYSPASGNLDRRVLIIYLSFNDRPPLPGQDANWVTQQFFGTGFPSAAGYFSANSFGRLQIRPAFESQGTVNDGVIMVNAGNSADFLALDFNSAQQRRAIELADPFVNYAQYDTNNDGVIRDDELIIFRIHPPQNANDNCGAARGVAGGPNLDGKQFGNLVSIGSTATNLMTHIHELAHSMLRTTDLYGFGVGSLDISGPTCSTNQTLFFNTSAWQKTHLGWIQPTVVTRDGYYVVSRADQFAQAYILYNPAKGTDDYFIVENRQRTTGTYDQTASDSGLVIWRIDEQQYGSGNEAIRPIDIMRPDGNTNPGCGAGGCYGGSNGDAWNPADTATPQRTMTRTWRDGTAAGVAVRAIGPSANHMLVYFDVRGPGILVDPTRDPIVVQPGVANSISFPVMNTGEASDSFRFRIEDLPPGWASTTQVMTIGTAVSTNSTVQLTVPASALAQTYTLTVFGQSTTDSTVQSRRSITVRVANVPPTVSAGSDASLAEGDLLTVNGLFNDPGTPGSYSATINWGDGSPISTQSLTAPTGSGTVSGAHAYGDNGTYTVQICVTDSGALTGCDSLTAVVTNVPPEIAPILEQTVLEDQPLTLSTYITDVGVLDTHTAVFSWGDGSSSPGTVTESGGAGTVSATHAFAEPGKYEVKLAVTDDDGGVTETTVTITVVPGFFRYCAFGQRAGWTVNVGAKVTSDCGLGSNGRLAVSAYAHIGGDLISYGGHVQIARETAVQGSVEASDKVIVHGAEVCGNILAGGEVIVWPDSLVCGDIAAAGQVKVRPGAVISGAIQAETAVLLSQPIALLPAFTFAYTDSDQLVPTWGDVHLPPGEYGRLIVNPSGDLHLSSGVYTFRSVELRRWSKLHVDLSGGPIVINVNGDWTADQGVLMDITSTSGTAADLLMLVGRNVSLGERGVFVGTFIAPEQQSTLGRKSTLTGALYGHIVRIGQHATIHGQPALDLFAKTWFE